MSIEVLVPAVGESVTEGMIHKWHKSEGDFVQMDEVIAELETDKATVEIVSQASGVIHLKHKQGDTVKVGAVLASIDTSAPKPAKSSAVEANAGSGGNGKAAELPKPVAAASASKESDVHLSPAVQRMVSEQNIDPKALAGSGRGGRVTKTDVVNYIDSRAAAPIAAAATPAAKVGAMPKAAVAGGRGERREPMSMLRRRVAERLVHAQHTAAILTTFNEIDMTNVMALRAKYKDSFKEKYGIGLGFMSFFVKAAVEALQAYPAINGWVEGNEIVYHDYCDIGVAVSSERGLLVPVVRDCQGMSLAQLEQAIAAYAVKARDGKIAIEDLSGGTFTVSNGGVFGSLLSTPILNPPQSGILGMHKIEQRPVVVDGQVVARPMMYVALSYDHRIVDGKEAVSFLVKIKECIEDPARLLLGV